MVRKGRTIVSDRRSIYFYRVAGTSFSSSDSDHAHVLTILKGKQVLVLPDSVIVHTKRLVKTAFFLSFLLHFASFSSLPSAHLCPTFSPSKSFHFSSLSLPTFYHLDKKVVSPFLFLFHTNRPVCCCLSRQRSTLTKTVAMSYIKSPAIK